MRTALNRYIEFFSNTDLVLSCYAFDESMVLQCLNIRFFRFTSSDIQPLLNLPVVLKLKIVSESIFSLSKALYRILIMLLRVKVISLLNYILCDFVGVLPHRRFFFFHLLQQLTFVFRYKHGSRYLMNSCCYVHW